MDNRFRIVFSHPRVGDLLSVKSGRYHGSRQAIRNDGYLEIWTGANNITWGYGLNSVTFPTYGGEVVQNLSAYIDDLKIEGDLTNYAIMEEVYLWFLTYMTVATQGFRLGGEKHYNEDDVTLWVPFREWTFKIRPKTLPGLRYATEVTAPTWQLTAAIMESDSEILEATIEGAKEGLERVHAGIGYERFNPFSSPTKNPDFDAVKNDLSRIGNQYAGIVEKFAEGDFSSYNTSPSGPPPAKKTATKTTPKK